jgi:acyl transferase domain-containing protein/acyl carrier protein
VRLVQQIVAAQLGGHERDVDGDRNFRELGLDSNGAVAVTALLGEALGETLHPTLLFEYQTPNRLAGYLDARVEEKNAAPADAAPDAAPMITVCDAAERGSREPSMELREQDIAIIGMACKLPGAEGLDEYWRLLVEGRTAIGEAPADRLPAACFEQGGKSAHISYSKWGAFVDRPYDFDPMFFGISPREAAVMDPQQRLFLEVAWQALQQSGYGERRPAEVGVFVGCEQNYYGEQFVNYQHYERLRTRFAESDWFPRLDPADRHDLLTTLSSTLNPAEISSDVVAGNGTNEIAARLSHCLDLKGPSVMVNTACSSSLVALHWACESLRAGETKMAVIGGVYLNFGSTPFVFLSRIQALSPDGSCAPFDRDARGMVLGEGVSALVLKPLRQAVKDRDFIHAVIKGSAINNDGHSQGITVPSPDGQAEAIRKAYHNAGLTAEDISYIECHGTGTSLGDPIEVAGLTRAFRSFTGRTQFCAIGSVKSSIGHMLAGAGLASVIKVVLAMKHRLLPATVGFKDANPYIDFASTPFFVAAGQALPWTGIDGVRRAGVNAFGFGGTNCHLILEEAPELPVRAASVHPVRPYLVVLNGRTAPVVGAVAQTLRAHLEAHPELETGDVAFSMNTGQREMACKATIVADSRVDLLARLDAIAAGATGAGIHQGRSNPRKTASLHLCWGDRAPFTAEESEELARHLPVWASARREALDACVRLVPAGRSLASSAHTFAAQYALGRLLMALDISPAGVVASKTGILAATCLTGGSTLPEAALSWCRHTYPGLEPTPLPRSEGLASDRHEIRLWKCAVTVPAAGSEDGSTAGEDVQTHAGPGGVIWSEAGAPSMVNMTNTPAIIALDPHQPPLHRLLDVLGRLYVAGVKFDSLALLSGGERRVLLPTYPFEHSEYRVTPPAIVMEERAEPVAAPPVLAGAHRDDEQAAPAVLRLVDPPALGDASRRTSRAALIKELAAADAQAHGRSNVNVYDAF